MGCHNTTNKQRKKSKESTLNKKENQNNNIVHSSLYDTQKNSVSIKNNCQILNKLQNNVRIDEQKNKEFEQISSKTILDGKKYYYF